MTPRLTFITIAILSIMLMVPNAKGDDWHISLLLGSHHTVGEGYCEFNPGVVGSREDLVILAYKNSECNLSVGAGFNHKFTRRLHGTLGVVLGYERAPVVPFATLNYAFDHAFVGVAPMVSDDEYGAVFFYGVNIQ